jgi:hypothetical protein
MHLDWMSAPWRSGKSEQESSVNKCITPSSSKERWIPLTCKRMRIRAKGRKLIAWMGMAIDATSRLWMAGVVSARRDRGLADRLLHQD